MKVFHFLFLCFLVSGLFPSFGHAYSHDNEAHRILKVWDRDLEYQLLIQNDERLSHDGQAFIKNIHSKKVPYVVLNPAFFEKEAGVLFERLSRERSPSSQLKSPTDPELKGLEERLLAFQEGTFPLGSLTPSSKGSLKRLQSLFEEIAWRDLYKSTLEKTGNLQEAKELFAKEFTHRRLDTIEYHEAAHLYDILNSTETKSPEFERFTEINAFYAELVYGENPHDTMAQALSGLMDEMNRGKVVDYSLEKVLSMIRFLRDCPRFAKLLKRTPLSPCCLEMLAKIKRNEFIRIGTELFQKNQDRFLSKYAFLTK